GIIAIKIREGDELVGVQLTSGEDDLLMVSKSGHASRFNEDQARPMGRGTSGVKGMNVGQKDNRVLALAVARDDAELLVVTENGFGKRTDVSEYPVKNRGTKGVLTAKLTEVKGGLAGALIVREHQELLFITENGMVQRTTVAGIRKTGRATQGVKAMNVRDGDHISAVALVVESATPVAEEEGGEQGELTDQAGLDGEAVPEAVDGAEDQAAEATDAPPAEPEAADEE
ncbi:MAG: DNA gyrase C-terminal beta-propeller domain-containing protein, partial [Solirubrobacterales bacterium]